MAELALREDNAPFSGLGFPYAGIEAAVGAAKQVDRGLSGIARKNAVSLRAVEPRLRQRVLEADNLGHGFCGRFGSHRLCAPAGPEHPLVAFAGIGAEVFCEFVRHVHEGIGVRWGRLFLRALGQSSEYLRLRSSQKSRPGSVSGFMASTGHSGSQTPQSMHSSGWMTSIFTPS